MYAPAELITSNHKWNDEFLKTTANPSKDKGGTCFGDSGGPVLVGDTNIVIGVTSWGTNYPCKGVSYASRIDTVDINEKSPLPHFFVFGLCARAPHQN